MASDERISDHDRDAVAERLRVAYGEGRLTLDEFEDRLDRVYQARTEHELTPLVGDLPAPPPAPVPVSQRARRQFDAFRPLMIAPVICTVIYLLTDPGGYFWPVWVWFGCLVPLLAGELFGSRRRGDNRR